MLEEDQVTLPSGDRVGWISESGAPCPRRISMVDDNLSAKEAARRMREGEYLLFTGDYHHGRTLLKAVAKRLKPRQGGPIASLAERWHHARRTTTEQAEVLGRLLVCLDADGTLSLRRAQESREAVMWAWGAAKHPRLVSLRTLIGALGAAGWRRAGLEVEGLFA